MVGLIFLAVVTFFLLIRLNEVMGVGPSKNWRKNNKYKTKASEEVEIISCDSEVNQNKPKFLIKKATYAFDKNSFLLGAEKAFKTIDQAFNNGDRNKLSKLLKGNILDLFLKSIDEREQRKETLESLLLSINKIKLKEISYARKNTVISVLFESEQTKVLRNKEGKIIEGNTEYVQTIKQVWKFEQPTNATSPKWRLISISDYS